MRQKWFSLTGIGLAVMLIISFFIKPLSFFIFLSDSYFTISLLLYIIGLLGLILKQGTFDFFHYSLNKAKHLLIKSNKNQQATTQEKSKSTQLHQLSRAVPSFYPAFLKAGNVFLFASLICLLLASLT